MHISQRAGALAVVVLVACGDTAGPTTALTWPVSSAADAGFNAGVLDRALEHIRDDLPNVNAFLVARGGRLVVEEYFNATGRATLHSTRSVTKSVVSAVVGVAVGLGWIDSLDQPVAELLPTFFGPGVDSSKQAITVRHLLTMSSGLNYDATSDSLVFDSWLANMADAPTWTAPGAGYRYDSANPHLLSGAVSAVTGFSMSVVADEMIFERLNLGPFQWASDPQGFSNGSTGLFMAAQDLAKFGELYRLDGVWNGERILPAGWVEASSTPWVDLGNDVGYGFLWWVLGDRLGSPAYLAAGFREQYVVVLPELDIVVVIASEALEPREPVVDHLHLVSDYVVPAAR